MEKKRHRLEASDKREKYGEIEYTK